MIAFALANRVMPSPKAANIAAGALLTSGYGAGLIGLPTGSAGLLGLTAVVGAGVGDPLLALALLGLTLLAFVPLLTAHRLLSRARKLLQGAPRSLASIALGAAAIILPAGIALLIEIARDARREADLRSGDRERVLQALAPDSWYGPRDIIGGPSLTYDSICRNLSALPLEDPAVESAARLALKTRPEKTVHDDCGKAR
jgi:hypothetical protein